MRWTKKMKEEKQRTTMNVKEKWEKEKEDDESENEEKCLKRSNKKLGKMNEKKKEKEKLCARMKEEKWVQKKTKLT